VLKAAAVANAYLDSFLQVGHRKWHCCCAMIKRVKMIWVCVRKSEYVCGLWGTGVRPED